MSLSTMIKELSKQPIRVIDRVIRRRRWAARAQALQVDGHRPNRALVMSEMGLTDERVREIMRRANEVQNSLRAGDRAPLDRLLDDRRYVFVVGSPRSGGQYTLRKLHQHLCSYRERDFMVLNESLPHFYNLVHADIAENRSQATSELIQWAIWVDERYPDHEFVVKKSSAFPFAMDLVDEFLGDHSREYIVTMRHPAATLRSAIEHRDRPNDHGMVLPVGGDTSYIFRKGEDPDWWASAPLQVRALHYWTHLYTSLAESLPEGEEDRVVPIRYGEHDETLGSFFDGVSTKLGRDFRDSLEGNAFRVTEREYDTFWSTEMVKNVIRGTRETWNGRGLELSVDPDRIH